MVMSVCATCDVSERANAMLMTSFRLHNYNLSIFIAAVKLNNVTGNFSKMNMRMCMLHVTHVRGYTHKEKY